jgi:hypothetical protein
MESETMTDPRPRNAPPRISLSAREWKLFVIGGLGVAYAASLGVMATQAQPAASQPTDAAATTSMGIGNTVIWLDQLPVGQRPTVALPPGWTIAVTASQTSTGQDSFASVATSSTAPSVARVPRILTRTS